MAEQPKILVVEDNPVNFTLLSAYLQEAGFVIVHAAEGHSVMQLLANHPDVSVVLLDRILPDMDGLELLRTLKTTVKTSNLPVIMLTAALSTTQISDAMIYGAYDCLPKPYNKDKIILTIRKALEDKSGGRRGR